MMAFERFQQWEDVMAQQLTTLGQDIWRRFKMSETRRLDRPIESLKNKQ